MVTWLNLAMVTPNRIFLAPVLRWHVITSLVSPWVFWRDYVSPNLKYEPCGVMCPPNAPEMPLRRTKKVRLGLIKDQRAIHLTNKRQVFYASVLLLIRNLVITLSK